MAEPIDPKIIGGIGLEQERAAGASLLRDLIERSGDELENLREALASKTAELEQERGRNDADAVMARMMKPYADKTFVFVCIYCACAFFLVLFHGWRFCGFELPETVLSIITGSTAASVVGLVGIVVGGLFRREKR